MSSRQTIQRQNTKFTNAVNNANAIVYGNFDKNDLNYEIANKYNLTFSANHFKNIFYKFSTSELYKNLEVEKKGYASDFLEKKNKYKNYTKAELIKRIDDLEMELFETKKRVDIYRKVDNVRKASMFVADMLNVVSKDDYEGTKRDRNVLFSNMNKVKNFRNILQHSFNYSILQNRESVRNEIYSSTVNKFKRELEFNSKMKLEKFDNSDYYYFNVVDIGEACNEVIDCINFIFHFNDESKNFFIKTLNKYS